MFVEKETPITQLIYYTLPHPSIEPDKSQFLRSKAANETEWHIEWRNIFLGTNNSDRSIALNNNSD